MLPKNQSFTNPESLLEFSLKALLLALVLAGILAVSNTYLALKIGMLTSASIPAALLSMGILSVFRRTSRLEHNLVQTCASSGEAVAGGVVYTLPGLILIHYWQHFPYWPTFFIAWFGGMLGILFSVPLRRLLCYDPSLPFPEAQAIAKVLTYREQSPHTMRTLLWSSLFGGIVECCQNGWRVLADQIQMWFYTSQHILTGFSFSFSPTLISAGYLMGRRLGISLFLGMFFGWFVSVPLLSWHNITLNNQATLAIMDLWGTKIRYIGIGAMLTAGLWTLVTIIKPLCVAINHSWQNARLTKLMPTQQETRDINNKGFFSTIPRTERDVPLTWVIMGSIFALISCGILFYHVFNQIMLGFTPTQLVWFIGTIIFYLLVAGFIICTLCGYFSGMVGVSASPGSAAIIAGILLLALSLRAFIPHLTSLTQFTAAAMTIIIGAVITAAASITNDNMQDLKVGQIIGATPWKQQIMLFAGVTLSALLIPWIMELLLSVYGIGDTFLHAGMDPNLALTAPPAAMMAGLTQAVFHHDVPWYLMLLGAGIISAIILAQNFLPTQHRPSLLGIAMGIYLPMNTSFPLLIGGLIGPAKTNDKKTVVACGLVAGAALMNVLLAIPFAMTGNPHCWQINGMPEIIQLGGSFIVFIGIMRYLRRK